MHDYTVSLQPFRGCLSWEMSVSCLFTYTWWLGERLQMAPVLSRMGGLDIASIFPSESSSKLSLWVYGCLVPSQLWYMGSLLIKHPSFKELKTV